MLGGERVVLRPSRPEVGLALLPEHQDQGLGQGRAAGAARLRLPLPQPAPAGSRLGMVVARLLAAGGSVVSSHNPYWDQWGVTVSDPDGYRLVLCERSWGV